MEGINKGLLVNVLKEVKLQLYRGGISNRFLCVNLETILTRLELKGEISKIELDNITDWFKLQKPSRTNQEEFFRHPNFIGCNQWWISQEVEQRSLFIDHLIDLVQKAIDLESVLTDEEKKDMLLLVLKEFLAGKGEYICTVIMELFLDNEEEKVAYNKGVQLLRWFESQNPRNNPDNAEFARHESFTGRYAWWASDEYEQRILFLKHLINKL